MVIRKASWIVPLVLVAGAASSCQSGYIMQQGFRQITLSSQQVALDSPEAAAAVPRDSREKLRWIPQVLGFCREEIGLDPGDSYTTFLDTEGQPISYVVMASHPLALIPYRWHFPFVGTVPYKGYFDLEDARAEAHSLREEGWEVVLRPVAAFSTLGWFQDPVLPSMLEGTVADMADLLIHEATHRTVYFPGEGSFNESLATHVAREATVRFLWSHPELKELLPEYLSNLRNRLQREQVFLRLEKDLEALYRSILSDVEKSRRKGEIFQTAAAAYQFLQPGTRRNSLPDSNADIVSMVPYHEHTGLLLQLQEALGGNPSQLVAYLRELPSDEDPVPIVEERLSVTAP